MKGHRSAVGIALGIFMAVVVWISLLATMGYTGPAHISGYTAFSNVPTWISIPLLYLLCIGVLTPGRKKFEGRAYNVSFASKYGDICLITCVWIATTILQFDGALPVGRLAGIEFQLITVMFTATFTALSLIFLLVVAPDDYYTEMNVYHAIVVVPLLMYLLFTMLPVTYMYGSSIERVATGLLFFMWVAFLAYDVRSGRIDQTLWLKAHPNHAE